MTIKKLYALCSNLTLDTRVCIMEHGRETYEADFVDVYNVIRNRKIKWLAFEDGVIIIKLKRKR